MLIDNKITLKKYGQELLNDRDKMKKIQENKNYTSKSLKTEGFREKTREEFVPFNNGHKILNKTVLSILILFCSL